MSDDDEGAEGPNPLGWALTFGDLVTNLMLFFIVLYAMSTIKVDKLLQLSDSMKKALNKTAVESTQVGAALLSDPRRSTKTTAVSEAIEEAIKALGLEKGVTVSEDERGIIISLVDSYFFDPGLTFINPRITPLLTEVGNFVRETNALVHVEGHTDNTKFREPKPPIHTNWELSALRATEVVRFFIRECNVPRNHLVALGYGDTSPLLPNTSLENMARNRRIDIVLMNAVIRLKAKQIKEPTTLDIVGGDKSIKERIKAFESRWERSKQPETAPPAEGKPEAGGASEGGE